MENCRSNVSLNRREQWLLEKTNLFTNLLMRFNSQNHAESHVLFYHGFYELFHRYLLRIKKKWYPFKFFVKSLLIQLQTFLSYVGNLFDFKCQFTGDVFHKLYSISKFIYFNNWEILFLLFFWFTSVPTKIWVSIITQNMFKNFAKFVNLYFVIETRNWLLVALSLLFSYSL